MVCYHQPWMDSSDLDVDELILRTGEMAQLERPQMRNTAAVREFICADGQLCEPDRDYVDYADDLIALGGDKEHSWVHGSIEELVTKTSENLSKVGRLPSPAKSHALTP